MRVGIISDIHANIYGLRAVLKKLKQADIILCAGDILGYYPFVNEVFHELDKHHIHYIRGNHDDYVLRGKPRKKNDIIQGSINLTKNKITKLNLRKLKQAKTRYTAIIDGIKIKMYHGSPWNTQEEYIYPNYPHFGRFKKIKADVLILGNTHYPFIKKVGNLLIINPGSCGQPRDRNPKASCALLNTQTKTAKIIRVSYDTHKVIQATIKAKLDKSLITILTRRR